MASGLLNERPPIRSFLSRRLLFALTAALSILPGCARQTYQAQYGTAIRSAVVADDVPKPNRMHYRDLSNVVSDVAGGAAASAAGGIVGGVIYSASTQGISRGSGRNLESTMALNNIRIEETVRRATAEELTRSGLFPGGAGLQRALAAGRPEVMMMLRIEEYGFGQSGFMQRGLVPILKVEGRLVRVSDQKELWEESVEVDTRSHHAKAHLYEEYRNSPALIREAFDLAAHAVASDMVRNMKGEKERN